MLLAEIVRERRDLWRNPLVARPPDRAYAVTARCYSVPVRHSGSSSVVPAILFFHFHILVSSSERVYPFSFGEKCHFHSQIPQVKSKDPFGG